MHRKPIVKFHPLDDRRGIPNGMTFARKPVTIRVSNNGSPSNFLHDGMLAALDEWVPTKQSDGRSYTWGMYLVSANVD